MIYKKLALTIDNLKDCEMEIRRMSSVREVFGLTSGGSHALIAMGSLMGGDYNMDGAKVGGVHTSVNVSSSDL